MTDESNKDRYLEALGKIQDTLCDTQRCVMGLDKKVDLHIQKTEFELQSIKDLDAQQNEILAQHHKRSDELAKDNYLREVALRKDLSGLGGRVSKLEEPRKWLQGLWSVLLWIFALAGGLEALLTALEIWSKH